MFKMSREESFVAVKNNKESSVPSIGSDEDSFVVLETTNSISDNACSLPREEIIPPIRTNKVHEVENLIKMKISQINTDSMPELPAAVDTIVPSVASIAISPDSSYEEIQKQVEELIKENEKLKNIIAQNNMSMKSQYNRFLAYRDEMTNVMKSYKDKFNEAKICVEKCKDENSKLANEVEVYINLKKLHEEEIINLKQKIRELENSNSISIKPEHVSTSSELQNNLDTKKLSISKLEEEIQLNQQKITDLEFQILAAKNREADLKEELLTIKNENTDLHSKLLTLRKDLEKLNQSANVASSLTQLINAKDSELLKFKEEQQRAALLESTLTEEVKTLKEKLKDLKEKYNPRLAEDYIQSRAQLSVAQRTITALEQEMEEKIKEIENVRKLLQESSSYKDEMFALKQQLDVYKNDFEAEKQSKVALKQERDQIAEDLKNVQARNKQLQNEVETLRERMQPKAEGYQCPKCSFGFNTYQSLENHVHRCLDLEGFP